MKFRHLLTVVAATIITVVPGGGQEAKPPVTQRRENALYPIATGYKWHYRVTDLKAPKPVDGATKKPGAVVVAAGSEQIFLMTRKDANGADIAVRVIGFDLHVSGTGTALSTVSEQVLVDVDGVYRISGAGKAITPPLKFLKADVKKGDVWTCDSQSENISMKGEFVADTETIQVPAGEFNTIVVRTRDFQIGAQKMQLATWYSKVGMVKQHVQSGNHNVVLELEKVESK